MKNILQTLFRINALVILGGLVILSACSKSNTPTQSPSEFNGRSTDRESPEQRVESVDHVEPDEQVKDDFEAELDELEKNATPVGKAVMSTGRKMIRNEDIILGSCWDYVNEVYNRAGFTQKQRKYAFKSKKSGPYANLNDLQTGDWLYIINHNYGDVEHSGIFIGWTDRESNEGMLISYVGGRRQSPGRYDYYDLSHVYTIIRGVGPSE